MRILEYVLLIFLILCAIGATVSKRLLVTVIIFMAYSTVMAVIWLFLEAPDLAITEDSSLELNRIFIDFVGLMAYLFRSENIC